MHEAAEGALARRIGLFGATMIVMGGIVGSGIFLAPAIVARGVKSPVFIVGAWVLGGLAALLGAFVYGELAAHRPNVGGQYAYLRDAFHPLLGFMYGWALLLVIQGSGMAASALVFANRTLLDAFLDSRTDLEAVRTPHGTTSFPRFLGGDTRTLCELLRDRYETAVVPGHFFGRPDHFRIGLGCDTELLRAGLERLGAALDSLR